MPLAHHVIFSAYGFWLPNDPRGSGSDFVRKRALFDFGAPTRVETRSSVAHVTHDRDARQRAKAELCYPPVQFSGIQARAIGRGFGEYCARSRLTIWACAILPEHVHLVIADSAIAIEWAINQLKGAATRRLVGEGIHPMANYAAKGRLPSCWGRRFWNVFLDTPADVLARIPYVEDNPVKEGKRRQNWLFVLPYPQSR